MVSGRINSDGARAAIIHYTQAGFLDNNLKCSYINSKVRAFVVSKETQLEPNASFTGLVFDPLNHGIGDIDDISQRMSYERDIGQGKTETQHIPSIESRLDLLSQIRENQIRRDNYEETLYHNLQRKFAGAQANREDAPHSEWIKRSLEDVVQKIPVVPGHTAIAAPQPHGRPDLVKLNEELSGMIFSCFGLRDFIPTHMSTYTTLKTGMSSVSDVMSDLISENLRFTTFITDINKILYTVCQTAFALEMKIDACVRKIENDNLEEDEEEDKPRKKPRREFVEVPHIFIKTPPPKTSEMYLDMMSDRTVKEKQLTAKTNKN